MNETFVLVASGIVAGSCPVLFAAIGETLSEKSGVINLSLDGCILLSALSAFVASYHSSSILIGFVAAVLTGSFVSLLLGFMSIFLGVSQVALGFVLSLLCRDLAYFLGNSYNRLHGSEVLPMPIPFLSDIPFIGPTLFNQNLVVYCSLLSVFLLWFYTERTVPGLMMKSVGENPHAAFARGYNPKWIRLIHVIAGGAFAGLAGASFSLFVKAGWGRPQGCEGTGWIALALVIFGGWSFWRVAFGCYVFSFLQIMGFYMQQWFVDVPSQVFQVAPFPLMIFSLILVHFSNRFTIQSRFEKNGALRYVYSFIRLLSKPSPAHLGKHFEP